MCKKEEYLKEVQGLKIRKDLLQKAAWKLVEKQLEIWSGKFGFYSDMRLDSEDPEFMKVIKFNRAILRGEAYRRVIKQNGG